MADVQLKIVGDYLEAARAVVKEAPEFEGIEATQYKEERDSIALKIPLNEVEPWMEMLETLADETREDDVDLADKYEMLAGYIEEEAEKFGREVSNNPFKASFWRGI